MTDTYNIGDLVDLTATFTLVADGSDVDPTTVLLTICDPDENETTPAFSNPSTGVFTASVLVDKSGTWKWRITGTGAVQKSGSGSFYVEPNTF